MMRKEIELLNQLREPTNEDENWVWHLSKLISEGKGLKYNCAPCGQPGLGPTYICERADCQWVAHKSCLEQPLPSGSAHKCLYPGCSFLIHQSCIDIPIQLSNHSVDPNHFLFLKGPLKEQHCDVCGRLCSFSYHCYRCDFAIHIKCASRGLMSVDKCHPHEFIVIPRGKVQQTCEACGQQNSELFYLCKNCRLWIHQTCFRIYPHTIKTKECTHFLTYTFFRRDEHTCRLCKELVDKRYAAYLCDSCGYVAHLLCAFAIMESSDATLLAEDKTTSLQEIENHFSHPEHRLLLDKEDPKYDQRCMGCMDRIVSSPFYGCAACGFFLHVRCAALPRTIKCPFAELWPLTLLPKMSSTGQRCLYCRRTCTGFVYHSDELSYLILDIQCSLLQRQLKHDAHQHLLFYEEVAIRDGDFLESAKRNCNGCNSKEEGILKPSRLCPFAGQSLYAINEEEEN